MPNNKDTQGRDGWKEIVYNKTGLLFVSVREAEEKIQAQEEKIREEERGKFLLRLDEIKAHFKNNACHCGKVWEDKKNSLTIQNE